MYANVCVLRDVILEGVLGVCVCVWEASIRKFMERQRVPRLQKKKKKKKKTFSQLYSQSSKRAEYVQIK